MYLVAVEESFSVLRPYYFSGKKKNTSFEVNETILLVLMLALEGDEKKLRFLTYLPCTNSEAKTTVWTVIHAIQR